MTERMIQKALCPVLNCPETFCLTLRLRIALSEPLLSGGMSKLYKQGSR